MSNLDAARAEFRRRTEDDITRRALALANAGAAAAAQLPGTAFDLYHAYVTSGVVARSSVDHMLSPAARRAGIADGEVRRALEQAWRLAEQTAMLYNLDGPSTHWQPDVDAPPGWHAITAYEFITKNQNVEALWGTGDSVLWAEGEALMIAGPLGVGKTSLIGRLIRAQLRTVGDGTVLGQPVRPIDGRVLLLAMDRPRQAARSLARQFSEADLEEIGDRLLIREGPPVQDMAKNPQLLKQMADYYEAETVYIDSLKDAAVGLSDDDVGAAYNRARQGLIAARYQVCELHHVIKRFGEGNSGRLTNVADVYGSTWLTAGAGSVIGLSGEPNARLIQFNHLRAPIEQLGPWTLQHDHETGLITVQEQTDLVELAENGGADGITAKDAATAMFETDTPTRNQIAKATYELNKLTNTGQLVREGGEKGRGHAASWFPAIHSASEVA